MTTSKIKFTPKTRPVTTYTEMFFWFKNMTSVVGDTFTFVVSKESKQMALQFAQENGLSCYSTKPTKDDRLLLTLKKETDWRDIPW